MRVVHERAGQELSGPRGRRRSLLKQRLANALGDAAMDLALDDHRVDRRWPKSSTAVNFTTAVTPVSGSTSTSAMWQPAGKVKFLSGS